MTPSIPPCRQASIGRFAPSPTGRLHLGHVFSALCAHDRARAGGGRFLVRIEDLDEGRVRAGAVDAIIADLSWVGLAVDGPVWRQSERLAVYREALERLRAMGLLYKCICTRAEVASLSAPHGDLGPIYGGRCRLYPSVPDDPRPYVWRLDMARALALVDPQPDRFWDGFSGWVDGSAGAAGDVVLARKDGRPAYHLAVVVDDAAQGVTEVVRGRDLLASTPLHRLLQTLLRLPHPDYAHHPLVLGSDGKRLAKRDRSATLADLRADGWDPVALVQQMRAGVLPPGYRFDHPRPEGG